MSLAHILVDTFVHMPPKQMLGDLTEADASARPDRAPHSVAEIVAHLDFWQGWFLRRCRGEAAPMASSAAAGWPAVSPGSWVELRDRFLAGSEAAAAFDAGELERRIAPAIEFPPLAEYTVRDALTHMAMHNSHHLGQVVLIRQLLGSWPPPSGSFTW